MHRFEHHWHPMDFGHGMEMETGAGVGFGGLPAMLLTTLSTLFWVVLFTWLVWVLLRWVLPYIFPLFAGTSGEVSGEPVALEILRQRYAAGEIDGITFEHMRERLNASYRAEQHEFPLDDDSYMHGTWM